MRHSREMPPQVGDQVVLRLSDRTTMSNALPRTRNIPNGEFGKTYKVTRVCNIEDDPYVLLSSGFYAGFDMLESTVGGPW